MTRRRPWALDSVQPTDRICIATDTLLLTWHCKSLDYFLDILVQYMKAIKTQSTLQNKYCSYTSHCTYIHHLVTPFSPFFTVRFENTLALALLWEHWDGSYFTSARWFLSYREMRAKTQPMVFRLQPEGFVWFLLLACKGYKATK